MKKRKRLRIDYGDIFDLFYHLKLFSSLIVLLMQFENKETSLAGFSRLASLFNLYYFLTFQVSRRISGMKTDGS